MDSDSPTPDPLLLSRRCPHLSAKVPVTWLQKFTIALMVFGLAYAFYRNALATSQWIVASITLFYLVFTLYRLALLRFSISSKAEMVVSPDEARSIPDIDLPVYSVLVPVYKEAESLVHVVAALKALDYPDEKKDVQLLLETDDDETRGALASLALPEWLRVTLIPPSLPRTKPKACNIGLALARGEFLVIYDAEDRPERDQLRKAVAAFRRADPRVVCLQSRLNFYNPRQNLLTRWFTAEYSAWFDLTLPGLCALGAVIPLGGTSNHFPVAALRELHGWDAYNVTEDCDLGIRIYRAGYRSIMLNTTTWEEACSSLRYWIRQRTRWLKGYIQTYFVHMRRPLKLLLQLGLWNFLNVQLLVGGIVFSFLINPVFWLLALVWVAFRIELFTELFPVPVFIVGTFCLMVGNFAFVYAGAAGCYKRGYFDLVKYTLLAPISWAMMSYSGWRAVVQFVTHPFRWEKTQHGLFQPRRDETGGGA